MPVVRAKDVVLALINRNHLINAGLVVAGLMVGGVMVETGLRILDFSYPAWEERDSDLSFIGLPGAEGWWTHEG